jgi:acetyltransferase-like isoleucine patch superfamily enzyme
VVASPIKILLARYMAAIDVASSSEISVFRIKGQLNGSSLIVADESIVNAYLTFERPHAAIEIGARTFIGKAAINAAERVSIGNDVLVSWDVTIVDHDSHSINWAMRARDVGEWREGRKDWANVRIAPVKIHDKAWIGFGAKILRGVEVGEGAVIGAGSVVTRSIPAWTVAAGVPAKVIKQLEPAVHERK